MQDSPVGSWSHQSQAVGYLCSARHEFPPIKQSLTQQSLQCGWEKSHMAPSLNKELWTI